MSDTSTTVRLRVSPEVARVVAKGAPREARLQAARGALPLGDIDLVTALFFLRHSEDAEIRAVALQTLKGLRDDLLASVAADPSCHPRLLDFIARLGVGRMSVVEALLANQAVDSATLCYIAEKGSAAVLELLAERSATRPGAALIAAAILSNPAAAPALKSRLGAAERTHTDSAPDPGGEEASEDGGGAQGEENFSKYQLALEMGVSEKIKMALTGDKEWRGIFLKDPNKLVSCAVLKNPRITDGEVLAVAKNKSAGEELIRLITLNREWVKSYEIKKALVLHPRTPLPKALRYMDILTEKDIKTLAKSRGVSQVIVNNARRILMVKQQKKG